MKRLGAAGFSLGELLVAFLILSLVSVLLVGTVPATVLGLHSATQRSTAALIAENTLEQLRRSGFGQLAPSSPPHTTVVQHQTEYEVRIEVGPASLSSGETMDQEVAKAVQVIVSWTGRSGPQQHISSAVTFRRI